MSARAPFGGLAVRSAEPATTAAAATAPVLLLHGMMGGAWQFDILQPVLGAAGLTTHALTYRGHHHSRPVRRLGRVRVGDYARDALTVCETLPAAPVVVGQSMGGLIALMLAGLGAVRAAALVCALPPAGITWRTDRPLATLAELPRMALGLPLAPRPRALTRQILDVVPPAERPALLAAQVPESSRAAFAIAAGLVAVDPSTVRCPLLSVTAGRDRLVAPEVGHRIARRYGGEHLHLPDAGHYALVAEPGARGHAAGVADWVARHAVL